MLTAEQCKRMVLFVLMHSPGFGCQLLTRCDGDEHKGELFFYHEENGAGMLPVKHG